MFSNTPTADELQLESSKKWINFYKDTGNPALMFTNVGTDLSECFFGGWLVGNDDVRCGGGARPRARVAHTTLPFSLANN